MSLEMFHLILIMSIKLKKPYSTQTALIIDEEVRKLVETAVKRTEELLLKHKEGMISVAKLLIEKEKIDAEDMVNILGNRPESAFSDKDLQEFLSSKKQARVHLQ